MEGHPFNLKVPELPDYFVPGGVVIERNPDRFRIDNPGTLLVSLPTPSGSPSVWFVTPAKPMWLAPS